MANNELNEYLNSDKLKALKEAQEKYKTMLETQAQEILADVFKRFFEKMGGLVTAVRWCQYTPYFNDGETCYFGVREPRFLFAMGSKEEGEYGDDYLNTWDLRRACGLEYYAKDGPRDPELAKIVTPEVYAALNELAAFCGGNNSELFEAAFGDHAQVTAKADGTFDNDEYSHD